MRSLPIMFVIWLAFSMVAIFAEVDGNPKLDDRGVTQTVTATSPGGNAEGKEVRFGPTASGAVVRIDHRHLERFRELDARQLHARGRDDVSACT